jgi:hypothetical protein
MVITSIKSISLALFEGKDNQTKEGKRDLRVTRTPRGQVFKK